MFFEHKLVKRKALPTMQDGHHVCHRSPHVSVVNKIHHTAERVHHDCIYPIHSYATAQLKARETITRERDIIPRGRAISFRQLIATTERDNYPRFAQNVGATVINY